MHNRNWKPMFFAFRESKRRILPRLQFPFNFDVLNMLHVVSILSLLIIVHWSDQRKSFTPNLYPVLTSLDLEQFRLGKRIGTKETFLSRWKDWSWNLPKFYLRPTRERVIINWNLREHHFMNGCASVGKAPAYAARRNEIVENKRISS